MDASPPAVDVAAAPSAAQPPRAAARLECAGGSAAGGSDWMELQMEEGEGARVTGHTGFSSWGGDAARWSSSLHSRVRLWPPTASLLPDHPLFQPPTPQPFQQSSVGAQPPSACSDASTQGDDAAGSFAEKPSQVASWQQTAGREAGFGDAPPQLSPALDGVDATMDEQWPYADTTSTPSAADGSAGDPLETQMPQLRDAPGGVPLPL